MVCRMSSVDGSRPTRHRLSEAIDVGSGTRTFAVVSSMTDSGDGSSTVGNAVVVLVVRNGRIVGRTTGVGLAVAVREYPAIAVAARGFAIVMGDSAASAVPVRAILPEPSQ